MTLLPGGRDQQISEEMIEAAAKAMWQNLADDVRARGFEPKATPDDFMRDARSALTAVASLLPDETAIRAKIADEIEAEAERLKLACTTPFLSGLHHASDIARGSATEETR